MKSALAAVVLFQNAEAGGADDMQEGGRCTNKAKGGMYQWKHGKIFLRGTETFYVVKDGGKL